MVETQLGKALVLTLARTPSSLYGDGAAGRRAHGASLARLPMPPVWPLKTSTSPAVSQTGSPSGILNRSVIEASYTSRVNDHSTHLTPQPAASSDSSSPLHHEVLAHAFASSSLPLDPTSYHCHGAVRSVPSSLASVAHNVEAMSAILCQSTQSPPSVLDADGGAGCSTYHGLN